MKSLAGEQINSPNIPSQVRVWVTAALQIGTMRRATRFSGAHPSLAAAQEMVVFTRFTQGILPRLKVPAPKHDDLSLQADARAVWPRLSTDPPDRGRAGPPHRRRPPHDSPVGFREARTDVGRSSQKRSFAKSVEQLSRFFIVT